MVSEICHLYLENGAINVPTYFGFMSTYFLEVSRKRKVSTYLKRNIFVRTRSGAINS